MEGFRRVILPIALDVSDLALFRFGTGVCGLAFANWKRCSTRCRREVKADKK